MGKVATFTMIYYKYGYHNYNIVIVLFDYIIVCSITQHENTESRGT